MSSSEVKSLHQSVAGQLLPKSTEVHNHIKEFLTKEVKDFENINRDNDKVLDQLKNEWDQYNKIVSDVKSKKTKDTKFIEGGTGYLKAKEEEIKAKGKIMESINTGLKESVTKIKPEKLAELPYEKEPKLRSIFQTLYLVLYNEKKAGFDWPRFKKLALLHENGQDFITRLANLDFKNLSQEYHDELKQLQFDPVFKEICQNSLYSITIVDIADWVDYVIEGYKVNHEKKQTEADYDKIRKDISKRSDGSTQLKEEFCNETLKDIDHYQSNLMNLQSQLKTLIVNMNSSLIEISDIQAKRNSKIKEINAI